MHERLCALKGLLRAVSKLEESIRDSYGVTLTEALCLCSVGGGCALATNLGDEVALSPSRLSRVLSSLEKKELLSRKRRMDDKRSWDLFLTEDGAKLVARMRDGEIEIPSEILAIKINT
ncbi:MAG: MarR family transcriptional regulator [Treponemataceae bacterium]